MFVLSSGPVGEPGVEDTDAGPAGRLRPSPPRARETEVCMATCGSRLKEGIELDINSLIDRTIDK